MRRSRRAEPERAILHLEPAEERGYRASSDAPIEANRHSPSSTRRQKEWPIQGSKHNVCPFTISPYSLIHQGKETCLSIPVAKQLAGLTECEQLGVITNDNNGT
jgi:hypothetical protein